MKEEPNSKNQKISKTAQIGGPVENCLFSLDTETVFIDALRLNGLSLCIFSFGALIPRIMATHVTYYNL
jgi:hypothetical protein